MIKPLYYEVIPGTEKLDLQIVVEQFQESKNSELVRVILYKLKNTLNYYLYQKSNYFDKSELLAMFEDKLMECLNKYDHSKGIRFITFYSRCLDNVLINFNKLKSNEQRSNFLSIDYEYSNDSGEGGSLGILDKLIIEDNSMDKIESEFLLSSLKPELDNNEYRVCEIILAESHRLKYTEIANEAGLTLASIPGIVKRLQKKFRNGLIAEKIF